eukprot:Blabericola_migrator_1__1695@NODE_1456_length_4515_cov_129_363534_g962_i0_p5_GENE_NODE_1456_length_4515_cov_129_363534_g962_i0NODE_1456_length_4515_cov_129_363534_g962_i0_p5_ORF_typecomplete_len167_score40_74EFhand_8/PF13833_6/0_56EFhand_8/PF13833_6/1_4e05EFhand_8/PF13833_6/34EFhand_8/PF13833_6/1_6e10EFhand_7/PF13499_6/2_7e07EFhand_7/PF13499_6/1_4e09EFhand_11/PF08976_11/0_00026EFhand_11/PF08976_11/1_1e05EFhand_1/PF00036_32/7_7e02EFhand_1/PF00036_32/0_93EFhand_1/PF00036_32/91EFhand_1/PF00036_32/1
MRRTKATRTKTCAVSRDELSVLFKIFDTEDVGTIDTRELKAALRALGLHVSIEDVHQMLTTINKSSPKEGITFDDFCRLAEAKLPDRLSRESLLQTFELFGGSRTQPLDIHSLKAACDELGEEVPDEELQQMISHADQDQDGLVTFEDFERVMKRKYDPFASSDSE